MKAFIVDTDAVVGDLLAGRLILRRCKPAQRETLVAMLKVIASTALHDLITAGEIDGEGDLLAQVDEQVMVEVSKPGAGACA